MRGSPLISVSGLLFEVRQCAGKIHDVHFCTRQRFIPFHTNQYAIGVKIVYPFVVEFIQRDCSRLLILPFVAA